MSNQTSLIGHLHPHLKAGGALRGSKHTSALLVVDFLREHSHGKDMAYIKNTAIEDIEFVKSKGIEIGFSSEDSFRLDLVDLLSLYPAVDKVGCSSCGYCGHCWLCVPEASL